jgi:hypothetical protein
MLWTLLILLAVLWLFKVATFFTLGLLVFVLLFFAVALILVGIARRRDPI